MYTLLLLTALVQPVPATGVTQPAQVVARIDKGNLIISSVTNLGAADFAGAGCYGLPGAIPPRDPADPTGKAPAKAPPKVKVTRVVVTTVELSAREVEAYTTDGKAVAGEKLAELLARDRTVLIALDGKKVDPFHLQLYKEGTIVLVPPTNTLHLLQGGPGPVAPYAVPRVEPVDPPRRLPPDNTP